MLHLQEVRPVGAFDVVSASFGPLGFFDVEKFKTQAMCLLAKDSRKVGLDLSGVPCLYSDSYNAFLEIVEVFGSRGGEFAIIVENKALESQLKNCGLPEQISLFSSEAALLNYSIQTELKKENRKPIPIFYDSDDELSESRFWSLLIAGVASFGGLAFLIFFLI